MYGRPVLFLLAVTILGLTAEQRKLHRLAGGHLRIINPDSEDSELMHLEASGSREKKPKSEQEEKKTLAQQVADGKYGLIQKELFAKPQKRPGVLSYDDNSEVPNDNKDSLGGLHKNEIWLAENHLLVIRGGTYPPHEEKPNNAITGWPAIDDFKAPLHQVKIPKHPKVPPPFPVQLTEDGPLQILGTNSSRTINESVAAEAYAVPSLEGLQPDTNPPLPPDGHDKADAPSRQTPLPIPLYPPGEYPQGAPFPPFALNGTLPPYFASLPPGAAILPPPGNQSDFYDEDDPSIYYPPPYSFYYPKDNSSAVQPGPLVPGIILPPPPNFFGALEETTTRIPQRQRKPTTIENPQIHPTTTPVPPTEKSTTKKPFKVYPTHDSYNTNEISPVHTTMKEPNTVTILPVRQPNRTYVRPGKPHPQRKKPQVTVLQPIRTNTSPPTYSYENEISDKPFVSYGPPRATKKSSVTTTQVPLKYFTTVNEIETNSVTQPPSAKLHVRTQKPTQKPVQFYFYEELGSDSVTTQPTPVKQNAYIDIPDDYYIPAKPTPPNPQRKPQYIYVSARPYNTQKPKFRYIPQPVKTDTFSIHIAKLQNEISQYYTTSRPTYRPIHSPKPVYQFSFQAANYQPQPNRFKPSQPDLNQDDQFRPIPKYSVQIQQAIEIFPTEAPRYQQTPAPVYYNQKYRESSERPGRYYTTSKPNYAYETITQTPKYQNLGAPKPISQYSFEVTPNPIYQGFYTKPDEGFFDDNTKKYFTMFGRKLPSSTSPLPSIQQTTARPNFYSSQQNSQYQERPISLESDTLVNYAHPRPTVNPNAELISPNHPTNYPKVVRYPVRPAQYVQPQKPREENPEIIKAIPIELPSDDSREGSFISYQLPGDRGAHFYFLTPQLSQRRDQGSNYYYSQPNTSRTRRKDDKDKER